MHRNFEEACGEEIGVTLPNLTFPKLILCCMPSHSHLGSSGDPALGCWRACRLCTPAGQLGVAALVLHLMQAAFPHSGYHRLKEGAVPTIFETFSKLRRTTKSKGHNYTPGPPDVSRLRRCRKRYVLQVGGAPLPPQV